MHVELQGFNVNVLCYQLHPANQVYKIPKECFYLRLRMFLPACTLVPVGDVLEPEVADKCSELSQCATACVATNSFNFCPRFFSIALTRGWEAKTGKKSPEG